MTPPRLSTALALLATLLGLSALLGWALDIAALKQGLASSVAMNPATAVCLALLGLEAVRMNALNANAVLAKAGQLAILVVIAAMQTLSTMTESDQLALPLPVARQDEIGEMISAFNGLLASLARRTADLVESRARYERAINGTNEGIWE